MKDRQRSGPKNSLFQHSRRLRRLCGQIMRVNPGPYPDLLHVRRAALFQLGSSDRFLLLSDLHITIRVLQECDAVPLFVRDARLYNGCHIRSSRRSVRHGGSYLLCRVLGGALLRKEPGYSRAGPGVDYLRAEKRTSKIDDVDYHSFPCAYAKTRQ